MSHAAQPPASAPSAPPLQGQAITIKANDGVALEAYWSAPKGAPPAKGWPCVIQMHGYSKGMNPPIADQFMADGYLAIVFSSRGNKGSEGYNTFSWREIFDVRDVIDHAIANLHANPERIGLVGGSFGGYRSMFTTIVDKRVRAIAAGGFPARADFGFMPNNVPVAFTFYPTEARTTVRSLGMFDDRNEMIVGKRFDEALALANLISIQPFVKDVQCPVFLNAGMMDIVAPSNGLIPFFESLQVPRMLFIGPGGHEAGSFNNEAEAQRGMMLQKRWLAHWLKDEDNGIMEEPAVHYPIRPDWEPVEASAFPGRKTKELRLHLAADGESGSLQADPPGTEAVRNIVNKLKRPGWDYAKAYVTDPAKSLGALEESVLTFDGEPLAKETLLLGAPTVHLHVQSKSLPWQIYAELYDVPMEGAPELVSMMPFGVVKEPKGGGEDFAWDLRTVAYRFKAGHRIRLILKNHGEPLYLPYYDEFECRVSIGGGKDASIVLPVAAE